MPVDDDIGACCLHPKLIELILQINCLFPNEFAPFWAQPSISDAVLEKLKSLAIPMNYKNFQHEKLTDVIANVQIQLDKMLANNPQYQQDMSATDTEWRRIYYNRIQQDQYDIICEYESKIQELCTQMEFLKADLTRQYSTFQNDCFVSEILRERVRI